MLKKQTVPSDHQYFLVKLLIFTTLCYQAIKHFVVMLKIENIVYFIFRYTFYVSAALTVMLQEPIFYTISQLLGAKIFLTMKFWMPSTYNVGLHEKVRSHKLVTCGTQVLLEHSPAYATLHTTTVCTTLLQQPSATNVGNNVTAF